MESSETGSLTSTADEAEGQVDGRVVVWSLPGVREGRQRLRHVVTGVCDTRLFLLLLCLICTAHGFVGSGTQHMSLPKAEERFYLTDTQTGLLAGLYNISLLAALLIGGYIVTKDNQSKLLAMSSMSLTFGSLLLASQNLLTDAYQPEQISPQLCHHGSNGSMTFCEATIFQDSSAFDDHLYLYLVGEIFLGVSGALIHIVGLFFIDKSVSSKELPTFLGFFYSALVLGSSMSYTLNDWLSGTITDLSQPPSHSQPGASPARLGGRAIGFLIVAAVALLITCALLVFSRLLPGSGAGRRSEQTDLCTVEHPLDMRDEEESDNGNKTAQVLKVLTSLVKNPIFLYQCVAIASEVLVVAGISKYIIKFVANQFHLDLRYSTTVVGLAAMPLIFLGQLAGGALVRVCNSNIKGILRVNIYVTAIGMMLAGSFLIGCELGPIAGVTIPINSAGSQKTKSGSLLTSECNSDCGCSTASYDPVCVDGVEYFTPCHAGCSIDSSSTFQVAYNCSCSARLSSATAADSDDAINDQTVVRGKCTNNCTNLYIFLPLFGLMVFFTFCLLVPATTVVLRSVEPRQTGMAIAAKQLTLRIFGSIPAPLLFGALLDNSCIVWQEECQGTGSCAIYDNKLMGVSAFLAVGLGKVLSLIAACLAFKLYRLKPRDTGEHTSELEYDACNE